MGLTRLFDKYVDIISTKIPKYNIDNKLNDIINNILPIIKTSPATQFLYEPNCFVGGYLYRVMEYYKTSLLYYDMITKLGIPIEYDVEDLTFCILFHNLGSVTDGKYKLFNVNSSEWHIRNKGMRYIINKNIIPMLSRDRTLYILTCNNIPMDENVYLSIYLQDWDKLDSNKYYISNIDNDLKIRYTLPYTLYNIISLTNIKLLNVPNDNVELPEVEFNADKIKTKVYNRTKKVKSKIELDFTNLKL